jgi:uncharacterized protein (DUF1778 family)
MGSLAKEVKSERLVARISKSHKRFFERAAAIEGRSVATFVVAHALAAAEELLRKQELIRLNTEAVAPFRRSTALSAQACSSRAQTRQSSVLETG